MKHNFAFLPVVLLLGSSCDRDPTFVTTKDRPPVLTFAYAKAEGSIVIKEEPFGGTVALVCPSGRATGQATASWSSGAYSILVRLEVEAAQTTEQCRIDVGDPVVVTQQVELQTAERPADVVTKRHDVIIAPDSIAPARMDVPIVALAAGGAHSCAVAASGAMYCWGSNDQAQLGTGFHVGSPYAVRVATTQSANAASAGGGTSCFLDTAGMPFCWGDPGGGAVVSYSTAKELALPRAVANVPALVTIKAGPNVTCGLASGGTLYCWGLFYSMYQSRAWARPLSGVVDFAVGARHACAVTNDGAAHCWDAGNETDWGQLGTGQSEAQRFAKIAAGRHFTCALDDAGFAWCWGRNDRAQLGRGTVDPVCRDYNYDVDVPCAGVDASVKRVATDVRFKQIDAGEGHVCALALDDLVYCWGEGSDGRVGNGKTSVRPSPQQVAAPLGTVDPIRFKLMAAGVRHTCGVATDERVYCWGWGAQGQLGTNDLAARTVPTLVWQP